MTDTTGNSGEDQARLDEVTAALAPFLAANPTSRIVIAPLPEGSGVAVAQPWGDQSLAIRIPDDAAEIVEALNNLVLPERLSAFWHTDTRELEIAWTARKLQQPWVDVIERAFAYSYQGKKHDCKFATASDRLLAIARQIEPQSTSTTQFRNMQSFSGYVRMRDAGAKNPAFDKPLSFWISNIDWDETEVLGLAANLNFYLTYYDNISPIVMIHDVSKESKEFVQRTRYVKGKFPGKIAAKPLDPNLIAFWDAAAASNQMMKFILYYRMLEYCSTQFIDNAVRSELRKIISAPEVQDDLNGAIERIVTAVSIKNLEEVQRFRAVVRQNVNPKLIWQDIKENVKFFSKEQKFEGGFIVKPLIGAGDKESGFCNRGLDQFSDQLRKIRNALSHGKDQETAGVILPTPTNMDLLRPWVHVIATAAGEVVLYKDVS